MRFFVMMNFFLATTNKQIARAFVSRVPVQRRSVTSAMSQMHTLATATATDPTHFNPLRIRSPSASASASCLFMSSSSSSSTTLSEEEKATLEAQINEKGNEIRSLKDGGADKAAVAPFVAELLSLKAKLDPSSVAPKKQKQQQQQKQSNNKQQPKKNKQQQSNDDDESDFITAREVNYSKWYNDIIRVTGLAETSPVRGCMVIKPWGMSIWDRVRNDLDQRIQDHGAENAYFPMLIPKSFLSKEAEHVDGFAKECAVVTHHRLSQSPVEGEGLIADPEAELEDPLIIRPTSETMIWYMFRKWISSHRYVRLHHSSQARTTNTNTQLRLYHVRFLLAFTHSRTHTPV